MSSQVFSMHEAAVLVTGDPKYPASQVQVYPSPTPPSLQLAPVPQSAGVDAPSVSSQVFSTHEAAVLVGVSP